MFAPSTANPNGLTVIQNEVGAFARGDDFAVGEIGAFDFELFAGGTNNNREGDPNSGFSSITRVRQTTQKYGIMALAIEDATETLHSQWIVSGRFNAWCAGTFPKGAPLMASDLGRRLVPAEQGAKVVAVAMSASAGIKRVDVLFDGQGIFGQFVL